MSVRFKHSDEYTTYFCTFTCYKWMPLIEMTDLYPKIYEWFILLETEGYQMFGYVLMPNHIHFIIYFPMPGYNLNLIISNGKRFLAYEIIKHLKSYNDLETLYLLSEAVTEREVKKGQVHKIFKESFDAKPIFSEKFLFQKLEYIHNNPVSGKWLLAKDSYSYEHSSAAFYYDGSYKYYKPTHHSDL